MNKLDLDAVIASARVDLEAAEVAQQRLAAIVESSDDAIVSKDLNGIITSWNAGAQRIFGYSAAEAIGKSITMLIPADHLDEEPRILDRIRRGERIEHYETIRQCKDGTLIDISLTVSPIKDAAGRVVGASKIARDVTEKRRAEAQRNLLVAELGHRVKNTLATVLSIAQQTFSNEKTVDEARASFSARIKALAQTHERLAESNWSGVPLETLLLDELAPYRREDNANMCVFGPSVTLTPKQALTLGLAIHELATNAAKYGALSVKGGAIDVVWQVDPKDKTLKMRWSEIGGPTVEKPERSGFGRLLLERAIAADLLGNVRLDFAASGLRCEIGVPLGDA